ncbi:hypothetical protein PPL_04797 [Heterostelium album PN500]|uniref:Uncharacterized protein n=1 Tax=Heterostelium pallidum (strain ATCC 26659 / Pp 5 / PN500) TaxID=670386 RepID=D3B8K4_HETP5|nr:hypothetical protein PPL_04797 [Heterostelium album PN500]EFA82372.1 hypothetical protein PPL_04797 [Heterostelium album PN500]|eukprot:XP_020434489.1 hypothetical protein PPL_04797 [Heterostelium album PN500]
MITKLGQGLTQANYAQAFAFHYFQYTAPIYIVDSSVVTINRITVFNPDGEVYHPTVDPLATGRITNLPIPTTCLPDPGLDGHMIVYDKSQTRFLEFSRFKWINSTFASATRHDNFLWNALGTSLPFNSGGYPWWMKGVRGSGAPFIAGLIRYDELITRGELNHALAIAGPTNRQKKTNKPYTYEACSPVAARNDGALIADDGLLEGQRIRLNPNYDISNFGPKAKLVAQALKTYGGYIVDNSPDFGLFLERTPGSTSSNSPWLSYWANDLISITQIPLNQLQVLNCSNIATK